MGAVGEALPAVARETLQRLQHSRLFRSADDALLSARLLQRAPYREGSTLGEVLDLEDWLEDRRQLDPAEPGEDTMPLADALAWLERHWRRLNNLRRMLDEADRGELVDADEALARITMTATAVR